MFMPFWDPTMILMIPAIILAMVAQAKVQRTYAKFSEVPSAGGRTGREIAQAILSANGLSDIQVGPAQGFLSDHYDPIHKTIQLSQQNYEESSIAAISVAAHECGHAIQHAHNYAPLTMRTAIFPMALFGTNLAWIFIIAGFIFANRLNVFGVGLLDIGIFLFTFGVIFQLVTLPVEFDASRRALVQLNQLGLAAPGEQQSAKKVLDAAALTYVAAASVAVLQLVRLLLIRGRR
jgi:Zn-dependent membrane protease YugP